MCAAAYLHQPCTSCAALLCVQYFFWDLLNDAFQCKLISSLVANRLQALTFNLTLRRFQAFLLLRHFLLLSWLAQLHKEPPALKQSRAFTKAGRSSQCFDCFNIYPGFGFRIFGHVFCITRTSKLDPWHVHCLLGGFQFLPVEDNVLRTCLSYGAGLIWAQLPSTGCEQEALANLLHCSLTWCHRTSSQLASIS